MIYVDIHLYILFFSHLNIVFVFKKVALVQGRSIIYSMNRIVISHLKYFCLQTENKWQVCSQFSSEGSSWLLALVAHESAGKSENFSKLLMTEV